MNQDRLKEFLELDLETNIDDEIIKIRNYFSGLSDEEINGILMSYEKGENSKAICLSSALSHSNDYYDLCLDYYCSLYNENKNDDKIIDRIKMFTNMCYQYNSKSVDYIYSNNGITKEMINGSSKGKLNISIKKKEKMNRSEFFDLIQSYKDVDDEKYFKGMVHYYKKLMDNAKSKSNSKKFDEYKKKFEESLNNLVKYKSNKKNNKQVIADKVTDFILDCLNDSDLDFQHIVEKMKTKYPDIIGSDCISGNMNTVICKKIIEKTGENKEVTRILFESFLNVISYSKNFDEFYIKEFYDDLFYYSCLRFKTSVNDNRDIKESYDFLKKCCLLAKKNGYDFKSFCDAYKIPYEKVLKDAGLDDKDIDLSNKQVIVDKVTDFILDCLNDSDLYFHRLEEKMKTKYPDIVGIDPFSNNINSDVCRRLAEKTGENGDDVIFKLYETFSNIMLYSKDFDVNNIISFYKDLFEYSCLKYSISMKNPSTKKESYDFLKKCFVLAKSQDCDVESICRDNGVPYKVLLKDAGLDDKNIDLSNEKADFDEDANMDLSNESFETQKDKLVSLIDDLERKNERDLLQNTLNYYLRSLDIEKKRMPNDFKKIEKINRMIDQYKKRIKDFDNGKYYGAKQPKDLKSNNDDATFVAKKKELWNDIQKYKDTDERLYLESLVDYYKMTYDFYKQNYSYETEFIDRFKKKYDDACRNLESFNNKKSNIAGDLIKGVSDSKNGKLRGDLIRNSGSRNDLKNDGTPFWRRRIESFDGISEEEFNSERNKAWKIIQGYKDRDEKQYLSNLYDYYVVCYSYYKRNFPEKKGFIDFFESQYENILKEKRDISNTSLYGQDDDSLSAQKQDMIDSINEVMGYTSSRFGGDLIRQQQDMNDSIDEVIGRRR